MVESGSGKVNEFAPNGFSSDGTVTKGRENVNQYICHEESVICTVWGKCLMVGVLEVLPGSSHNGAVE